jgi:hypothetical protein
MRKSSSSADRRAGKKFQRRHRMHQFRHAVEVPMKCSLLSHLYLQSAASPRIACDARACFHADGDAHKAAPTRGKKKLASDCFVGVLTGPSSGKTRESVSTDSRARYEMR